MTPFTCLTVYSDHTKVYKYNEFSPPQKRMRLMANVRNPISLNEPYSVHPKAGYMLGADQGMSKKL